MNARVLGRSIGVTWDQFLYVAAISLGFALIFSLLIAGVSYLVDGTALGPSFVSYSRLATNIASIIVGPLFAWLFLRLWKGKKDDDLCLSLAGSAFLLECALQIVTAALYIWLLRDILSPVLIASDALGLLAGVAEAAVGVIISYWWMLFFLKRDDERSKMSAIYGFSLALAFYVLSYLAVFVMEYYQGRAYSPAVDLNDLIGFASWMVFGFIVLYHAGGRKIAWNDAFYFGGLYIAGTVIVLVSAFIQSSIAPNDIIINGDLLQLAERAVWLAFLYVAATNWKDSL